MITAAQPTGDIRRGRATGKDDNKGVTEAFQELSLGRIRVGREYSTESATSMPMYYERIIIAIAKTRERLAETRLSERRRTGLQVRKIIMDGGKQHGRGNMPSQESRIRPTTVDVTERIASKAPSGPRVLEKT